MRRSTPPVLRFAVLAAALAIGACGSANATDPAAPLIVRGVVHDVAEHAVPGATVEVQAVGAPATTQGDEPGPVLLHLRATARPDGTFELRAAPTDALRQAAQTTNGALSFFVTAQDAAGTPLGQWQFQRGVGPDGWSGEAPGVVLRPVNSGPDGCC